MNNSSKFYLSKLQAHHQMTQAQRKAAATHCVTLRESVVPTNGPVAIAEIPGPGGTPDYFGFTPNYANSLLPPLAEERAVGRLR